jgi:Trk K+ transport system NAD-binding subunit
VSLDRTTSAVIWRAVPVLSVFLLTLGAFEAGVGVSDREGVQDASLGAHVYYAVGLFVLGGMDLGTPVGGPAWARAMLWVAYFLGPLITTTAVAEGFLALVHPRWLSTFRLRDHLVIAGAGHLGQIYADAVRAEHPRRPIVLVDLDDAPGSRHAVRSRDVTFVRGDILRPQVRAALRLDRARGLVLTTGSDLHNLEACWDALREHPGLRVAAHVADLGMRRRVAELEVPGKPALFNAHEVAARHLYGEHLARHFQHTGARDVVVLAGFGRFGQTLLEYLQTRAVSEIARVVVVDVHAARRARHFDEMVGFDDRIPRVLIEADIDDPTVWTQVGGQLHDASPEPVVVLCTDDDAVNLRAAMLVRRHVHGARQFVRVFQESAFTQDLAQKLGIEVLAIERLLGDALKAHVRECFP